MKKLYLLIFLCNILTVPKAVAQCSAGYTPAQLNWDYLDYLLNNSDYTANGYISSAALAYTQNFAFGPGNRLTIAASTTMTLQGDVSTHTGNLTNYTGDDVQFTTVNTGETLKLTFESEVMNVNFTIYDIERSQSMAITAANASGAALPVAITVQAGSILTIGNVSTAPTITANTSNSNNNNNGSATIFVAGPLKSITITINAIGTSNWDFYLSDINACVTGNFPINYHAVSRPFTGQGGYVLHAFNKSVYYANPATGFTRSLFTDAAGPGNINSMSYDPYNRVIYYVYSLTAGSNNVGNSRVLKKYDVNTGIISTVLDNINSIGVPTSSATGLESGAAAFYNGCIYLGVETGNGNSNSNREAVIWRLDLNGSGVPTRCSQVYALPIDDGDGELLHDWADIVIHNGILFDFDSAPDTENDIYHFNLMTGAATNFSPAGSPGWDPSQPALDWNGNVYQVFGTTAEQPYIALYNGDGTIGTRRTLTSNPVQSSNPSVGDAAEAFRPLCDFGDAPVSYDPDTLSPAVNELDNALRMGSSVDQEWLKASSVSADGDGADENGIGTVSLFNNLSSTYVVQDSVFNNTGANATVIGWLDYNANGLFDASEASAPVTVASGASMQSIYLSWSGISSPLVNGDHTYLRIRITSAANAMTSAHATGWFSNGETEDYQVFVDNIVLPITIISFDAKAINNSAIKLNWTANEDINFQGYEVQRSHNSNDWEKIAFVAASPAREKQQYELTDSNPYKGTSWYRLKFDESDGRSKYSDIRTVQITNLTAFITLAPNPAINKATVTISNTLAGEIAHLRIIDANGRQLFYKKITLAGGNNHVELPVQSLPSGTYIVLVNTSEGATGKKLVLKK